MRELVRALVEDLYIAANVSISSPPGPGALASILLGPDALDYDRRVNAPRYTLTRDHLGWRLFVSTELSDSETTMAVAAGLTEWWCMERHVAWLENEEGITAAIVLPQPALAEVVRGHNLSATQIAEAFRCPLSVVRLQMWRLAKKRISGTQRRFDSAG